MKIKAVSAILATFAIFAVGIAPARATIVKSTISISVPSTLNAGVANPIDVSVCSLSSASSKVCETTDERSVSLYADGKFVGTATTVAGIATFYWAPNRAGKAGLVAKVAAKGTLKALQSESQRVNVGKRVAATSVSTKYCTSEACGSGAPEVISFDDESATLNVLIGKNVATAKGRSLKLQFVNTSNSWTTERSGIAVWDADAKQYGYTFSLTIPSDDFCTNGDETYNWTYRALVLGIASAASAVSPQMQITFNCGGASGSASNSSGLALSVEYDDQSVDTSNYETPNPISADITDESNVGYTVQSIYCDLSDCSSLDDWYELDSATGIGSDFFVLSTDWVQGVGNYRVKVLVTPDDGSDYLESPTFSIEQY